MSGDDVVQLFNWQDLSACCFLFESMHCRCICTRWRNGDLRVGRSTVIRMCRDSWLETLVYAIV